MKYLSVCSGIEAASVAWKSLDWQAVGFSEIEPFCCELLKQRFPGIANFGDMNNYREWDIEKGTVDVLVGGTPCQSFSIAGLRGGLDDDRGNLALTFCRIAERFKPKWIVWENVPGVLSSNKGRDFGAFLGALGQLGYGFAYRVLNAQFWGLAQRRSRVFVIGYLGDWRPPAAVLFDSESLQRDAGEGKKGRQAIAEDFERSVALYYENHPGDSRITGPYEIVNTVSAKYGTGGGNAPIVMATGQANAEILQNKCPALTCNHDQPVLAFMPGCSWESVQSNLSPTVGSIQQPAVMTWDYIVRYLTLVECERLQGFPDNWTQIKWNSRPAKNCPKSHRYKAIGNSMPVTVMTWIGERIEYVEKLMKEIKKGD